MTDTRTIHTDDKGEIEVEMIRPEHVRLFHRRVKALHKLIEEIREYSPEANYYLDGSGDLCLMHGPSHSGPRCYANQDYIAAHENLGPGASGGDW